MITAEEARKKVLMLQETDFEKQMKIIDEEIKLAYEENYTSFYCYIELLPQVKERLTANGYQLFQRKTSMNDICTKISFEDTKS